VELTPEKPPPLIRGYPDIIPKGQRQEDDHDSREEVEREHRYQSRNGGRREERAQDLPKPESPLVSIPQEKSRGFV
jgi:hypothetical protein